MGRPPPLRILVSLLTIALVGLEVRLDADDWLSGALLLTAAVTLAGVLLSATIRHLAIACASIVAAASGALVSIALSNPVHNAREQREFDVLLYALLLAGTAVLIGQVWNQFDHRVETAQREAQLSRIEDALLHLRTTASRAPRARARSVTRTRPSGRNLAGSSRRPHRRPR